MSLIQARSRPDSPGGTDLYEEPFTNFGANAIEKLFSEGEKEELLTLIKRLAA